MLDNNDVMATAISLVFPKNNQAKKHDILPEGLRKSSGPKISERDQQHQSEKYKNKVQTDSFNLHLHLFDCSRSIQIYIKNLHPMLIHLTKWCSYIIAGKIINSVSLHSHP